MGSKNLNNILKKNIKNLYVKKNISELNGTIIGIDTPLFIYKFKYNNNNIIEELMKQIILFNKNNIKPIYVFDGKYPDEKKKNSRTKI